MGLRRRPRSTDIRSEFLPICIRPLSAIVGGPDEACPELFLVLPTFRPGRANTSYLIRYGRGPSALTPCPLATFAAILDASIAGRGVGEARAAQTRQPAHRSLSVRRWSDVHSRSPEDLGQGEGGLARLSRAHIPLSRLWAALDDAPIFVRTYHLELTGRLRKISTDYLLGFNPLSPPSSLTDAYILCRVVASSPLVLVRTASTH